jgi:hypothetical protein
LSKYEKVILKVCQGNTKCVAGVREVMQNLEIKSLPGE